MGKIRKNGATISILKENYLQLFQQKLHQFTRKVAIEYFTNFLVVSLICEICL